MKTILVVGAGREGKAFIGQTCAEAGWRVAFLDKDPRVIDALRETGRYEVFLHKQDATERYEVTGYDAYLADDEYTCLPAVLAADMIALCTYPEDIPAAAAYLGRGLGQRAAQNGPELSIICCTNKNHIIGAVQQAFEAALPSDGARTWFKAHVAVRDAIVRRSSDADTNWSTSLRSMVVATLLIQPPLTVDISDLPWMELHDDLEKLKEIKLYTYNAPHAACAYAGYLKGYATIPQAEEDQEIRKLQQAVLDEAVPALSREFGLPENTIWDFCTLPKLKDELVDSIHRVAFDPLRKLARHDRLTGNAMFCIRHGIQPKALTHAIACGMAYDDEGDPAAMTIQALIRDKGIQAATAQVCGLPADHALVDAVAKAYQALPR